MSNGQQLEMVEGNLVETRAAFVDVGDAIVGHKILSEVRRETGKQQRAGSNGSNENGSSSPASAGVCECECDEESV